MSGHYTQLSYCSDVDSRGVHGYRLRADGVALVAWIPFGSAEERDAGEPIAQRLASSWNACAGLTAGDIGLVPARLANGRLDALHLAQSNNLAKMRSEVVARIVSASNNASSLEGLRAEIDQLVAQMKTKENDMRMLSEEVVAAAIAAIESGDAK